MRACSLVCLASSSTHARQLDVRMSHTGGRGKNVVTPFFNVCQPKRFGEIIEKSHRINCNNSRSVKCLTLPWLWCVADHECQIMLHPQQWTLACFKQEVSLECLHSGQNKRIITAGFPQSVNRLRHRDRKSHCSTREVMVNAA